VARTMLTLAVTMLRSTRLLALVWLPALLLAPVPARAQTVAGPTVAQNSPFVPLRLDIHGNTVDPRPTNQNPTGVNYNDCISDMTLQFNVLLSGYDGSQLVEVWAGTTDCSTELSRGIGAGSPTCWLVGQPIAGMMAISGSLPLTVNVRVRDLVNINNTSQTYRPSGAEACQGTQAADTAQSINIYFLPTTSSKHNAPNGTGWNYPVKSDLVGPLPPANVAILPGDTLFAVNWTPSTDADVAGYNVYMDPIRGQEGAASVPTGAEPVLSCPGAGTPAPSTDATTDAGDDASLADADTDSSAITDSSVDDVCIYVTPAVGAASTGSDGSGTCSSAVLPGDPSAVIYNTGVVQPADANADGAASTTSTTGAGGGIWVTMPASGYLVGSVPDKTTGSLRVTGLRNGRTYNVVVAAVDGSGNVGPPSPAGTCDVPAPVNDFWTTYRQAGGQAGGGFCALEAVGEPVPSATGLAIFASASVLAFRRKRNRR
jgi:hypothetical protein